MASLIQNLLQRLNPQRPPNMVQQSSFALQRAAHQMRQSLSNLQTATNRAINFQKRYQQRPTPGRLRRHLQAQNVLQQARLNVQQSQVAVAQSRQAFFGQQSGAIPFLQNVQQALQSRTPGQALSATGKALTSLQGAPGAVGMAGRAAGAIAGPLMLVEGIAKASVALKEWTNHLHEANIKFADFSAAMSRVQYESELRQIHLSRIRGERRAQSAQYLAEEKDALATAMAPIEDAIDNVKNYVVGAMAETLTGSFKTLNKMLEFLGLIANNTRNLEDPEIEMDMIMRQMNIDQWYERYGRPVRFMGPPPDAGRNFQTSGGDFGS